METFANPLGDGFVEREIRFRSASIRYHTGGTGPAVVLVHGLGGMAGNWRSIAPDLARDHHVIALDLPGHGSSTPLPEAPNLDPFAEAVLAVLAAEDAPPAAWIGHSLGGVIGLRAAVQRPYAVRAIVLAGGAGISSATRIGKATVAMIGVVQPGKAIAPQRRRLARSSLGRTLTFGWWGVADPTGLDPGMAEAFLEGPARHTDTASAGKALVATDPRTDLDRVTCPCLCLWGANDNWVPLSDGIEYARRLRAPLRAIAGCGHLLIGERPEVVIRAVREFVDVVDG